MQNCGIAFDCADTKNMIYYIRFDILEGFYGAKVYEKGASGSQARVKKYNGDSR